MPESGGPIFIDTPQGTLSFNNYTTQHFFKVDEFHLTRAIRSTVDPAPRRDGAIKGPSFRGQLTPQLKGTVWASNITQRAVMLDNMTGYLHSILNTGGTLRWTPTGKAGRQLTVYLLDDIDFSPDLYKTFQIGLTSEDAVSFSQTQYSQDTSLLNLGLAGNTWTFGTGGGNAWSFGTVGTPAWNFGTDPGGGTTSCTNSGNTDSYPIIRLFGQATDPIVKNVTTGVYVSLPGFSIPSGNYVEIDMKKGTITYNGIASQTLLGYIDMSVSDFFPLATGPNAIRMAASTFDSNAKATIIWRDAWA